MVIISIWLFSIQLLMHFGLELKVKGMKYPCDNERKKNLHSNRMCTMYTYMVNGWYFSIYM